ncbi:hypothetical protein AJ87_05885 [Rhizobium yanglingense]|nr:hypothetical protein AJ87_05885 [Rhizobium yanglingense]
MPPVAGQTQVQITEDFCRVSKPGYAVETATPSQLAFDSSSRPAKIIAAGDIALPSGTTVFDFSANLAGISISGELVADVIQYQGSTIIFPASLPDDDAVYGAHFYFSGTTLVFSNPGSACRARILVIAQDNSPLTVGDNDVWREFNDGTRDVVQFLRPGAANPPNLADVIIDSRWPCLQIIKTGVFPIPNGNNAITDIAFNSAGLFPFIKYFTIHGAGVINSGYTSANASKRVRIPYVAKGRAANPDGGGVIRG